jgi:hypothetical protein
VPLRRLALYLVLALCVSYFHNLANVSKGLRGLWTFHKGSNFLEKGPLCQGSYCYLLYSRERQ